MGFLRKKSDPIVTSLTPQVALVFRAQGFSMEESTRMAIELVEQAAKESKAAGGGAPPGHGDELVRRGNTSDPSFADEYKLMREEGVTDDDIRWCWNMPDVDRRVMGLLADQMAAAHFVQMLDDVAKEHPDFDANRIAEMAGARNRKMHALYGDPTDESLASGDNRPLYLELKGRIEDHIDNNFSDMKALHKKIKAATSFNAWVRAEMRAGRL